MRQSSSQVKVSKKIPFAFLFLAMLKTPKSQNNYGIPPPVRSRFTSL